MKAGVAQRSVEFLAWLDQHGQTLTSLTQPMLEQWLSEGTSTRYDIDAFIAWARARRLVGDVHVPRRTTNEPTEFVDDDDRIAQLRRCLTDDTLPLDLRVLGVLVLLFGLLSTRVLHLKKTDIVERDGTTTLNIEGHELHLPPRVAALVRQQRDLTTSPWRLNRLSTTPNPWLFPSRSPTRPLGRSYLSRLSANHGLRLRAGRNTARLALAAELPASVLADLTGTSISNAVQWATWAKRDWTAYIAARSTAAE